MKEYLLTLIDQQIKEVEDTTYTNSVEVGTALLFQLRCIRGWIDQASSITEQMSYMKQKNQTKMKYVAQTKVCEQISPEDWEIVTYSMECDENTTLMDIQDWANALDPKAGYNRGFVVHHLLTRQEAFL